MKLRKITENNYKEKNKKKKTYETSNSNKLWLRPNACKKGTISCLIEFLELAAILKLFILLSLLFT